MLSLEAANPESVDLPACSLYVELFEFFVVIFPVLSMFCLSSFDRFFIHAVFESIRVVSVNVLQ